MAASIVLLLTCFLRSNGNIASKLHFFIFYYESLNIIL